MSKLFYTHRNGKYVDLVAPKSHIALYRSWIDFCYTNYPVFSAIGCNIRFYRKDFIRSVNVLPCRGYFRTTWQDVGIIYVAIGATKPIPDDEVRASFFYVYGHFLLQDQRVPYSELNADAENFANNAIKAFIIRKAIISAAYKEKDAPRSAPPAQRH